MERQKVGNDTIYRFTASNPIPPRREGTSSSAASEANPEAVEIDPDLPTLYVGTENTFTIHERKIPFDALRAAVLAELALHAQQDVPEKRIKKILEGHNSKLLPRQAINSLRAWLGDDRDNPHIIVTGTKENGFLSYRLNTNVIYEDPITSPAGESDQPVTSVSGSTYIQPTSEALTSDSELQQLLGDTPRDRLIDGLRRITNTESKRVPYEELAKAVLPGNVSHALSGLPYVLKSGKNAIKNAGFQIKEVTDPDTGKHYIEVSERDNSLQLDTQGTIFEDPNI